MARVFGAERPMPNIKAAVPGEKILPGRLEKDGRIRKWAKIAEKGKYLRVILLDDGETVHNAFFDRSFNQSSSP
ncbi:MAG: hypothetical protein Q9M27_01085 [Mariprofundaceae bacterium]|nr:hypothetical protein [Mariprofundaceae bacterium]